MRQLQKGLSLVEVMVAVLISTILVLGVTDLFGNSFFSSQSNTVLTNMQESGRVALEVIGADARRAGYQGCTAANESITYNGFSLPEQAVTSTAGDNVTFRFADPGTGCLDPSGQDYIDLEWSQYSNNGVVTYDNSNGTLRRNGQPMLDNAALSVSFLPTGNPVTANAIRVSITISDPRGTGNNTLAARTFSATYELRNKLL